ncbi:paraquat-inducible protein A [Echinimonas agarilytica]|uniref:Paraquat-inducible protein A n=1 Tax=Echinimonas agarilytica TaxID=1215918 RepID=A0AA42B7G9_9GAMM|nr:paraquat-inducible protein A [Echinimonas agarilytica]MCM2679975.1 paraquat-inducible protein A [Echinimonas agarilytica]
MASAYERGLVVCHCCNKLCEHIEIDVGHVACPRCETKLYQRSPNSLQRTWACLIAALILFLPANIYPISYFTKSGTVQEDTIMSGVIALAAADMLPIALIVFTASIAIPFAKIIGLSFILISLKFNILRNRKSRLRMYHAIEWIGKWSMLDLFVISIMATLVNLGQILDFSCGPAATAFAMVILLTVLATESFDTRLIWDDVND